MHNLLEGVSEIDWSLLGHAYGSAEHVPQSLAGLLDPLTAAKALDDLDTSIYHQGGAAYSAAPAVLPFLIRLAAHSEVPGRAAILDLLGSFARLQNEMAEPWKSKPAALACRAVLYDAFEVFRTLLGDKDPAIRAGTAAVVVELVDRADEVVHEVRRRYAVETDPAVRVEFVWVMGRLGAALSTAQRQLARVWLEASTPPLGDPMRLVFLMARRRIDPTHVRSPDMLAALDGARHPGDWTDSTRWIEEELVDERPARLILARRDLDRAVRSGHVRAMASSGAVMMKWRSATAELVPAIAGALNNQPDVVEPALHLLAAAGEASRPYLEDIAVKAGEPGQTGALAAWALARLGDERAVPMMVRSLRGEPDIYPMGGSGYTDRFYWLTQDPGIADVLPPMAAFADRIVPAIRDRLRRDERTPTAHQLGEVVVTYGMGAADAVPEFAAMLGTDRHRTACRVLAAFGPAAHAARDKLAQRATGGGFEASGAAWALFRVTGDPQPFLGAPDIWDGRSDVTAVARRLADFGPLAIRHSEHVELLLQEQRRSWWHWEGVELAYAHFRMTSEPALCLEVFDAALDPLRRKQQLPAVRQVLRYLAELGSAAARFEPLLRRVIEQDERLVYSGGWRGIAEDDEAAMLAADALHSITR